MCAAILFWLCISALIAFGLPELCEWLNQQDRLRAARVKPVRSRRDRLISYVGYPLIWLTIIGSIMVFR
jgi:hypothetical protein